MVEKTAGVISLGCSKNLVDTECILGILRDAGYRIVPDHKAEVVIINTCGFVKDAVSESHEVIEEIISRKRAGKCKKVIVAGCLPLRDANSLSSRFPELDGIVGSFDIVRLPEILNGKKKKIQCSSEKQDDLWKKRVLITPAPYSYLKISEGCSNRCTYCTIPSIKGDVKSRSIESILEEARMLVSNGVMEINIISQDTTNFGIDRGRRGELVTLLKELERIEGIRWIRLLYCHPANFSDELIGLIRDSEKICKYIDIPLQHINDRILQRMGRKVTRKEIESLILRIRKEIPNITLRTTFIVGFPGETDAEFEELYNFVREVKFERLGAFKYSREDGTPAALFEDQISEKVKEERYDALMRMQAEISFNKNQEMLNQEVEMLVEGYSRANDILYGRISTQAPEVDGNTLIYGLSTRSKFIRVTIVDITPYDFIAEVKGARYGNS